MHSCKHHSPKQTHLRWVGASHAGGILCLLVVWHRAQQGTEVAQPYSCSLDVGNRRGRGCRSGWCQSRSRLPQNSRIGIYTLENQYRALDTPGLEKYYYNESTTGADASVKAQRHEATNSLASYVASRFARGTIEWEMIDINFIGC